MSPEWPAVSLGDLIRLERRPVEVIADRQYQEIGVYCFGRGIFHKSPRSGLEVGDKALYQLREGDLILQVTFAWEGAIALCGRSEAGLYGSTRYPTFRVDEDLCFAPFLARYLCTPSGLDQINKICPGSAGRNRVLSIKRIPEITIPLPPLAEQQRIVGRIVGMATKISEARLLRHQAAQQSAVLVSRAIARLLDDAGWETKSLGELLAESPRNGLSPKPEVENGRPMLRINAVSSSSTRFVDLRAVKSVDVTDDEAARFVLQHDDVYIVRYNGDINRVAKPAIFKSAEPCEAVFPDKLMRLRPKRTEMLPDFLVFALNARSVREQVEELGKTTAGNIGISGADAKSFIVPVPPLAEQDRIVEELDSLQADVDALRRLQSETATELDALLPSILDRAFKGEL